MGMVYPVLLLLVVLALLTPSAEAWGRNGHSLTGRVAMQLVSETTKAALAKILPEVNGDISQVSSWADEVKSTPRFRYTAPLHYSDAHDDPPFSCSYIFARDCPDGNCVIAAIRNFTEILVKYQENGYKEPEPAPVAEQHRGRTLLQAAGWDRIKQLVVDLKLVPAATDSEGSDDAEVSLVVGSEGLHVQRRRRRRRRRPSRPTPPTRPPGGNPRQPSPPPRTPGTPPNTPPGSPPGEHAYSPAEALKFLVHLVQDVHQPLHLSGKLRGGNDAPVLFAGKHMNLHGLWDYAMLERAISQDYKGSEVYLTQVLLAKRQVEWREEADTWATCPMPKTPLAIAPPVGGSQSPLDGGGASSAGTSLKPLDKIMCPEFWAFGIDQLNCGNVWQGYQDGDLSGEYYERNLPVVLKSVTMGGVRLAALLEAIFNPNE
ncbi:phospholipase C/P1 nuclease domain-containing protein [Blastocladiella britannica]|nr:phospholipase C/P1 nuclease domain-containing protein [Blastocladiella britannica]